MARLVADRRPAPAVRRLLRGSSLRRERPHHHRRTAARGGRHGLVADGGAGPARWSVALDGDAGRVRVVRRSAVVDPDRRPGRGRRPGARRPAAHRPAVALGLVAAAGLRRARHGAGRDRALPGLRRPDRGDDPVLLRRHAHARARRGAGVAAVDRGCDSGAGDGRARRRRGPAVPCPASADPDAAGARAVRGARRRGRRPVGGPLRAALDAGPDPALRRPADAQRGGRGAVSEPVRHERVGRGPARGVRTDDAAVPPARLDGRPGALRPDRYATAARRRARQPAPRQPAALQSRSAAGRRAVRDRGPWSRQLAAAPRSAHPRPGQRLPADRVPAAPSLDAAGLRADGRRQPGGTAGRCPCPAAGDPRCGAVPGRVRVGHGRRLQERQPRRPRLPGQRRARRPFRPAGR